MKKSYWLFQYPLQAAHQIQLMVNSISWKFRLIVPVLVYGLPSEFYVVIELFGWELQQVLHQTLRKEEERSTVKDYNQLAEKKWTLFVKDILFLSNIAMMGHLSFTYRTIYISHYYSVTTVYINNIFSHVSYNLYSLRNIIYTKTY